MPTPIAEGAPDFAPALHAGWRVCSRRQSGAALGESSTAFRDPLSEEQQRRSSPKPVAAVAEGVSRQHQSGTDETDRSTFLKRKDAKRCAAPCSNRSARPAVFWNDGPGNFQQLRVLGGLSGRTERGPSAAMARCPLLLPLGRHERRPQTRAGLLVSPPSWSGVSQEESEGRPKQPPPSSLRVAREN